MDNCIFCKIIKREVPSDIVYEDDEIIAFKDVNPAAPIHVLVIPKKHIEAVIDVKQEDEALIGRIYTVINKIAEDLRIKDNGFRVIINCGEDGGQVVKHIHFHLLAGTKLGEKIV